MGNKTCTTFTSHYQLSPGGNSNWSTGETTTDEHSLSRNICTCFFSTEDSDSRGKTRHLNGRLYGRRSCATLSRSDSPSPRLDSTKEPVHHSADRSMKWPDQTQGSVSQTRLRSAPRLDRGRTLGIAMIKCRSTYDDEDKLHEIGPFALSPRRSKKDAGEANADDVPTKCRILMCGWHCLFDYPKQRDLKIVTGMYIQDGACACDLMEKRIKKKKASSKDHSLE